MKAIALREGRYHLIDMGVPEPKAGQLRVRVAYAGVNRADYLQTQSLYPLPGAPCEIPGLELAGTVDAAGDGVTMPIGTQVAAIVRQGAFAEYAIVDAQHTVQLPDSVALDHAAAITEALATTQMALYERIDIQSGEWLLLHGGAGGIGHVMLQWLAAQGVRVIAAVSDDIKAEFCIRHGATETMRYDADDWRDTIKNLCPKGLDAALDMAGGDISGQLLRLLKKNGRMTTIACLNGGQGQVPVGRLLTHRLQWSGCTLRDAPDDEKARIMQAVGSDLLPKYCTKGLTPVIRRVFPLTEASQAVHHLVRDPSPGKIVIKIAA